METMMEKANRPNELEEKLDADEVKKLKEKGTLTDADE